MSIERRLNKAKDWIERGNEFYAKAADEIIAALKEDPTLSQREVGQRLGRSERWVRNLVQSRTNAEPASEFKVDWNRGSRATKEDVQRTLSRPKSREAILAAMSDDERAELATDAVGESEAVAERVMAKPSKARTALNNASDSAQIRRRIRDKQDEGRKRMGKTTVSQYYWRILNQFTKWHDGLRWIEQEVDSLRASERPEVINRLLDLREEIDRCLAAVRDEPLDESTNAIDGRAADIRGKVLSA